MAATVVLTVTLGLCQRYDPGVMDTVQANREAWGHIPPGVENCIAVTDCDMLGREVLLGWPVEGLLGWFSATVCDCSADEDRERHLKKGLAAEVSYEFAVRHSVPFGPYRLPLDGPLPGVIVVDERAATSTLPGQDRLSRLSMPRMF
jgi:hypothetical protein